MARKRHDDLGPDPDQPRMVDPEKIETESVPLAPGDEESALRPRLFSEFVGQRKVADNLGVYVSAAKLRGGTLDHILLSGPPGLGKTTLAHVVAHEMGTQARVTSGPALERKGDLAGILTSLGRGDVLFIDEIHRLQPIIEESLYPAMEDFHIEIVTGVGAGASAITVPIERFTLVGATTRTGQLTAPLLSRFGIDERLDYYAPDELATIVLRSARLLGIKVDEGGAQEIGRRARGTPRIANRLLRRVHDFALVRGDGLVTQEAADYALKRLGVDKRGFDEGDRRLLRAIIERFDGGPVGIESLSAALAEDRDTLEYVHEPYLIQEGFLIRTPRGRQATQQAYDHLGLPLGKGKTAPEGGQGSLF